MSEAESIDQRIVSPRAWRSLWAVLIVQTQNAFNDNVARFALLGIALVVLQDGSTEHSSYKNIIGVLISLPFVLFAPIAGWVSDRFSKRTVIKGCLIAQIVIIAGILGAILMRDLWLATSGFFVLAIQSAFLGPAKLGIMKELVGSSKLAVASGWMQMLAILAIVLGSVAGGEGFKWSNEFVGGDPWMAGFIPIAIIGALSFLALVMLRSVQPTPALATEPLHTGIFFRHFQDITQVFISRPVRLSCLGVCYFWFAGAFAMAAFTQVAQDSYSSEEAAAVASYFMATTSLGIAVGSVLVSLMSSNRVELGLVPLGGIGLALSVFGCALFPPASFWFYASLFGVGMTAAVFLVPQNAYLQDKADPTRRGRILAASNLLNSLAAIGANVLQLGLQQAGLTSGGQFIFLGIASLVAAWYTLKLLPSNVLRVVLKMILRIVYRIRVMGEMNLPEKGGALMISNHVSWVDALIIGAACPRDVRFVAAEEFFRLRGVGWFLRLFEVIPISQTQARQAIKSTAEEVKKGSLVCLFPEGTLTRTGTLSELRKGFELIVRQSGGAPLIPVYLDNLWGSIFSFADGKFFFKKPKRFPYPVTVNFGEPIPAEEVKADRARDALMFLSSEAYAARPRLRMTLGAALIHRLKREGREVVLRERAEDRQGGFTRRMLLRSGILLALRWKDLPGERVGVLLPPGSAAVLTEIGLVLAGKTPVMLPLNLKDADDPTLKGVLEEFALECVITAKGVRDTYPSFPWPQKVVFVAEELRAVNRLSWWGYLPSVCIRWRLGLRKNGDMSDTRDAFVCVYGEPGAWEKTTVSQRDVVTQVAQIGDASPFTKEEVFLSLYALNELPGQWLGMWVPLLLQGRLLVPAMSRQAASAETFIGGEGVTTVVGSEEVAAYVQKALVKGEGALRMLITFDRWKNEGPLRVLEENGLPVCHAWCPNELGMIVSLGMPHPKVEKAPFPIIGYKAEASGRVIPGFRVVIEEADEEGWGRLRVTSPSRWSESAELGGHPVDERGKLDEEGFVYLIHGDAE